MSIDWAAKCRSLGLRPLEMSRAMFGGTCPVCGAERSFFVWLDKAPVIRAMCYACKVKMKIWDDAGPTWNSVLRNGK